MQTKATLLDALRQAMNDDTSEERRKTILAGVVVEYIDTQRRIADALEQIAANSRT